MNSYVLLNTYTKYLLILMAVLLFSGCGRSITNSSGDISNLKKWMDDVKARPAPALEPLPIMRQFDTATYTVKGMRDPFQNVVTARSNKNGPRPDNKRDKNLLEQYPLEGLKMVGTIGSGSNMTALITAPDQVTHRVRLGDYIGTSEGRVSEVHEDHINLVELISDGTGSWDERPNTLVLQGQ